METFTLETDESVYTFEPCCGFAPPGAKHFFHQAAAKAFVDDLTAATPQAEDIIRRIAADQTHNIGLSTAYAQKQMIRLLCENKVCVVQQPRPGEREKSLPSSGGSTAVPCNALPEPAQNIYYDGRGHAWRQDAAGGWFYDPNTPPRRGSLADGSRPLDPDVPSLGFVEPRKTKKQDQKDNRHILDLEYLYNDGTPVAGARYKVTFADGTTTTGRLDQKGEKHIKVPKGSEGDVSVEYEEEPKVSKELEDARTKLKTCLDGMVAEVAQESRYLSETLEKENLLSQGVILTGAFLCGLFSAGKDMVKGACDLMVTTATAYTNAQLEIVDAIRKGSLENVRQKIGAVAAQGERTFKQLQQVYYDLELIMGDSQCRDMLCAFPERYFDNLHVTEKLQMAGALSLDLVLALLTGGAAAAGSVLSKSRYAAKAVTLVKTITALLRRSKLAKTARGITNSKVMEKTKKIIRKKIVKHDKLPDTNPSPKHLANKKTRELNGKSQNNLAGTAKGEPVNCVTGEVIVDQTDFSLPGRLPLTWTRAYGSQQPYAGVCGPGWQTPADARLEIDDSGIATFADGAGTNAVFERVAPSPNDPPVLETADGAVLKRCNGTYTVTLKSGLTYRFAIGSTHMPVQTIADRLGNTLTFHRDRKGLNAIDLGNGRTITVVSENGRISRMSLKGRVLVGYRYNSRGELAEVIDALDQAYRFFYQEQRLVRHTDREGLSFYYTYDDHNRCTRTWGDNRLYDYRFDYSDFQTLVTNSLGFTQVYDYDDAHLPLRVQDHKGNLTSYEYDHLGRPSAVTDPLNRRTDYVRDRFGNLVQMIRPDGGRITITYDELHNPVAISDPKGNTHHRRYDDKGLLTTQISPTGAVTTYAYNRHGDLIRVTDPMGQATVLEPDTLGNTASITDPLERTTRYGYDSLGNLTAIIDPLNRRTSCTYDLKGRLTAMQKPSGQTIESVFDRDDRLVRYMDEAGQETCYEYFGIDKPARRIDPDGSRVTYHYDTEEQLVGVTDQKGRSFTISRDHAGRIITQTDYWQAVTRFTYDAAGQCIRIDDPLNQTTQLDYDPLGRLLTKTYADNATESFTYDALGNLTAHSNDTITVRRIFNPDNLLIKEVQGHNTLIFAHDRNGRRIKRRSHLNNRIRYRYDAAGQVRAIVLNNDTTVTIERDRLGRPLAEKLGNAIQRCYDYDDNDRLITQDIAVSERPGIRRDYLYDLLGNLIRRSDAAKGVDRFDYDPMGRITRHLNPYDKLKSYLYDPAGELAAQTRELGTERLYRTTTYAGERYTYNKAGQRIERYSSQGNRILYDWDSAGRLTGITKPLNLSLSMTYDALGRRITKQAGGVTTGFVWDGDALLSDHRTTNGPCEYVYYPGTFIPLAAIDANRQILYYHNDHIGMPQEVTDTSGRILWSARYNALGSIAKLFENTFVNPIRGQGQYEDSESGLYYNRHRFYSPRTGQFLSQDPVGLAAGENLYNFAPNVYGWIDPLGLCNQNHKPITDSNRLLSKSREPNATGKITSDVLDDDTIFYRTHGGDSGPVGGFLSPSKPLSRSEAITQNALPPGNTAEYVSTLRVQGGARVQRSVASEAFGQPGGANQVELLERAKIKIIKTELLK